MWNPFVFLFFFLLFLFFLLTLSNDYYTIIVIIGNTQFYCHKMLLSYNCAIKIEITTLVISLWTLNCVYPFHSACTGYILNTLQILRNSTYIDLSHVATNRHQLTFVSFAFNRSPILFFSFVFCFNSKLFAFSCYTFVEEYSRSLFFFIVFSIPFVLVVLFYIHLISHSLSVCFSHFLSLSLFL